MKIVQHVDVAIKSYVTSNLTGSPFDGFIDCTNIVMVKDLDEDSNIIHQSVKVKKMGFEYSSKLWMCVNSVAPLQYGESDYP